MKTKHWTITKDHLERPGSEFNRAETEKAADHVIPFKLYDDDGNLYYEGYMSEKLYEAGEAIFEPLDWAMADAGCTELKVNGPRDAGFQVV